ncbi:MAG: GTP-binding protein [Candidatus Altiarchaeota archaeon]|nr:GTP-binding protein [Candidatus Altiarchaeota archaeon]
MASLEEKIREIEEEIQKTPYNKATQHHIGKLKAKIARLRESAEKRGGKGKGAGFAVKKSGDATIALVGFPSVGKSTLLNKLTDARSRVGDYDFTTVDVIPGVMFHQGAKIQVLDIPGVITGASSGRGRGREILSIIRNVELILILVDVLHPEHLKVIEKELYDVGIRLSQNPPKVGIKRIFKGGLKVVSSIPLKRINVETIREILNVNGIHSAEVTLHEDLDEERFIDAVMKNRVYLPCIIALNKMDTVDEHLIMELTERIGKKAIPISAESGKNLDILREEIFSKLGIMRLYMKPQGGEPDYKEPLIMRKNSSVGEVCDLLHKDMRKKFKYAIVNGRSARFKDQIVGLEHILDDEDILTIVKKR